MRNEGGEQSKLGEKKGENKRKQQKVAHERFILYDGPQQRDEQIQPYDHVEKPEVIVPCDELRKHDRKRRVAKDEVDERVAARPGEKDRGDARDVLFEDGIDIGVPPEKQRAADHHKDGDRPANNTAVKVKCQPCI